MGWARLRGCICCYACLLLLAAFAEGDFSAEFNDSALSRLERLLSEEGIRCGYSSERQSLVVIGYAEKELPNLVANPQMFMACRNERILAAELDVRKNLIKTLKLHLKSRDVAALAVKNEDVGQANVSSTELSAERELMGCAVLRTCETYVNGLYQVAVAMQWSAQMAQAAEQTLCVPVGRKDSSGETNEWMRWASRADWSSMAGNRKFIDSEGIVRYVGIGCADVEGLEIASPWMRRAQDSALYQARANLSLALYSDTASVEAVIRVYSELSGELGDSSDSYESYIGKTTRQSNRQTVFAPEVYATFVTHPITKRKMFVSVCGYEPWQLAELGIVSPQLRSSAAQLGSSAKKESLASGVMLWNPNTGKFENQE